MATSDLYNILIIDSDCKSRSMLKDVALCLPKFKKVFYCSSLQEGINFGNGIESIDVVTISHRFPIEAVGEFIKNVKKTPRGKQWAFISVLKSSSQQNNVIAENMLSGVDGILFEPYSADNLKEMADITAKVKVKNEYVRMKGALEMFLKEVVTHLDAVAFYASQKRESANAKNRLIESSSKLKRFKSEHWSMYTEVLIEVFSHVPVPKGRQYHGVSQRVKDRIKAKVMGELEDKYKV